MELRVLLIGVRKPVSKLPLCGDRLACAACDGWTVWVLPASLGFTVLLVLIVWCLCSC